MINTMPRLRQQTFNREADCGFNSTVSRQILQAQIADFKEMIDRQSLSEEFLKNRLLTAMDKDCFERISPHLERVRISSGKQIYAAEENPQYIYFPENAVISNLHNLKNGNTLETAMIGYEGACGLSAVINPHPSRHQAVVIQGGTARRIKIDILKKEFFENRNLQIALLKYFAFQAGEVSQRAVCAAFHSMEERFCTWLLMMHDRIQMQTMCLTHEQISLILGVNRPGISVIAKNLRNKKLINYTRGKFRIINRKGLEEITCECYSKSF